MTSPDLADQFDVRFASLSTAWRLPSGRARWLWTFAGIKCLSHKDAWNGCRLEQRGHWFEWHDEQTGKPRSPHPTVPTHIARSEDRGVLLIWDQWPDPDRPDGTRVTMGDDMIVWNEGRLTGPAMLSTNADWAPGRRHPFRVVSHHLWQAPGGPDLAPARQPSIQPAHRLLDAAWLTTRATNQTVDRLIARAETLDPIERTPPLPVWVARLLLAGDTSRVSTDRLAWLRLLTA